MFSFKYSPRPNTLASKRMADDVSRGEDPRIVALQALQRSIQTRLHEQAVGTEVDVLVDSVGPETASRTLRAHSGNTVVNLPVPSDTQQRRGGTGSAERSGSYHTVRPA